MGERGEIAQHHFDPVSEQSIKQGMSRLAFHLDAFTVRGVERAVYDYANGWERHKTGKSTPSPLSYIIYPSGVSFHIDEAGHLDHDENIFRQYYTRFQGRVHGYTTMDDLESFLKNNQIEHLYLLTTASVLPFFPHSIKLLVHGVFDLPSNIHLPELNVCKKAVISESVRSVISVPCNLNEVSIIPHMIMPFPEIDPISITSFRQSLNIPSDRIIIGRYGGWNTFDIPFVPTTIRSWLDDHPSSKLTFVFMNTKPMKEFEPYVHTNTVLYLPSTFDLTFKARYVHMCDLMLHARRDGESFGLAICEFASLNKPILTYRGRPFVDIYFAHHETVLGEQGWYYDSPEDLYMWLSYIDMQPRIPAVSYPNLREYDEQSVMTTFVDGFGL